VLTVAVSVTSGVAALTTALPALQRLVLPLSLAAIGLIMWTNLRGVRESGRIFAVPTYLFVGSCAVMLLVGLGRLAAGHLDPVPAAGTAPLPQATASVAALARPELRAANGPQRIRDIQVGITAGEVAALPAITLRIAPRPAVRQRVPARCLQGFRDSG
jgi:amino acid transporter